MEAFDKKDKKPLLRGVLNAFEPRTQMWMERCLELANELRRDSRIQRLAPDGTPKSNGVAVSEYS